MDKKQFDEAFVAFLDTVRDAENITKRELGAMSVLIVDAMHGISDPTTAGDDTYLNRTLGVLSPMNRKTAVSFFQHFTGYKYDAEKGQFRGKDKGKYMEALAEAKLLLAGKCPLIPKGEPQNIWGWASKLKVDHPDVFDPEKVTKFVTKQVTKAAACQASKLDVLRAVFDAGFTMDDVTAMLDMVAAEGEARKAVQAAAGHKAPEPAPF